MVWLRFLLQICERENSQRHLEAPSKRNRLNVASRLDMTRGYLQEGEKA